MQTWTGGLLIAKGVTAAGKSASDDVGPADIINGLNTLKNETLGGFSPPLTFIAGKPHPVDCWYTGRVPNKFRR